MLELVKMALIGVGVSQAWGRRLPGLVVGM